MNVLTEQLIPIRYKSLALDRSYRIDLIVEDPIIVELKSVETVLRSIVRRCSHIYGTPKGLLAC
jgi:GxxExxY protein